MADSCVPEAIHTAPRPNGRFRLSPPASSGDSFPEIHRRLPKQRPFFCSPPLLPFPQPFHLSMQYRHESLLPSSIPRALRSKFSCKCVGKIDEPMNAFDGIVAKDVLLWTTVVAGLEKAGLLDDARKLFDDMPDTNVISWTVMIKGYSKAGRPAEAMEMFTNMLGEGILSDTVAFVSTLSACSESRDLEAGKWVHQLNQDRKIFLNENLIVSLVDMYAKCGRIDRARFVFDSIGRDTLPAWNAIIDGYCKRGDVDKARSLFNLMESPNLITFNSMITGYIQCSRLKEALSLFSDLLTSGFLPDRYTIVGLLSVCAILGALNKGLAMNGMGKPAPEQFS